ncbi:MAG TPA: NAD(P)-dependent oxidoreductase [Solirubrobacteraceae bacterium]
MTPDASRVGFVGLGNMGWPMAHNLSVAGFSLIVHDADTERSNRFAAEHAGATAATAASDFAQDGVTVTMLPDDRAVADAVLRWDGGIAAALAPGAVVVDMSSSNPLATRALGDELSARQLDLVDAPVSGGITRAADGTLAIMVGTDSESAFERARPVLEVLGARLFRTGPRGSGHAMKALNNFLGAAAYTTLAEALRIGEYFGLEPNGMLDVINNSTGRSFNSEVVFPQDVVSGRYGTGFALGLLAKDAGIAAALSDAAGADAPACHLVAERWAAAAAGLGATADHSEAHKQWERSEAGAAITSSERV